MNKQFLLLACFAGFNSATAQYPLVSIKDLQFVNDQLLAAGSDTSAYYLDTVRVEGVVTFNPCDYGLSTTGSRVGTWLSDGSSNEWSGVHVLLDPGAIGYTGTINDLNTAVTFIDNFQVGNKVQCTVVVSSFGLSNAPVPGNTQLLLLPAASSLKGIGQPIPQPPVLTIDQFMKSDGAGGQVLQRVTGERWEGVYVEFHNVQVVDVSYGTGSNSGRIFWSIQDQNGNKMQIRDVSGWIRNDTSDNFCTAQGSNTPQLWDITPYIGATLSYVRGIILEFCSSTTGCQYYVAPRDWNDIGPVSFSAPVVSNVKLSIPVPSTSQSQTVSATITDADGTVASATLLYSVGLGNTSFQSVPMLQSGGNTWTGVIPPQGPDSIYVNYWIKAVDNSGYVTNFPDSLATNSFYWVKNDGVNSLKDIQFNPTGSGTPFLAGKWLTNMNVEGIVMATIGFSDLGLTTIQDGPGAWNGIFLRGQNLNPLKRGDRIKITSGKVFESFNVTYLDSITYLVLSSGNPLYEPYAGLSAEDIRTGVFAATEPFEGVLLGFTDIYVVNQNPDAPSNFGEWAVDHNTSDNIGLRCDDYSNDINFDFNLDSLSLNQKLDYLYGVLYFSFSNWKLLPRNKNDIAGYFTVSVQDVDAGPFLSLYPNPTRGLAWLRIGGLKTPARLTVRNLSGQTIYSADLAVAAGQINELTLSGLPAGCYLVELRSGMQLALAKLMVTP
ncbi:MAG: T9SS type A sorting domain-containing protein [Chitinophagales bacterium]|nr:T9SS type A sorting domain-containing protein [Chitinophagales bacterium]MDW8392768.1 T9SS type A sorting domain-containing protein [Chitinophagales bacterium]